MIRVGTISVHHETIKTKPEDWDFEKEIMKQIREEEIRKRQLREQRNWKPHEITFLKQNYGSMTILRIAEHLKRDVKSVENKVYRLGLRKNK
jgi:hypothetical protein